MKLLIIVLFQEEKGYFSMTEEIYFSEGVGTI